MQIGLVFITPLLADVFSNKTSLVFTNRFKFGFHESVYHTDTIQFKVGRELKELKQIDPNCNNKEPQKLQS